MEYKRGVTGPNTPLFILLGIQLTYELDMQSQVAHLEGDMISRILERFLFLDLKHLSAFLFMVPEKVSKTFKNDFCESLELVQRWAERMWPQLPRVPHCLPISTALTALSLDSLSRFQEVPKRFQRGPSFNDFEFATCLSVLSMLPGFELDQAPSSRDAEKALDMRWPRPVGAKWGKSQFEWTQISLQWQI